MTVKKEKFCGQKRARHLKFVIFTRFVFKVHQFHEDVVES